MPILDTNVLSEYMSERPSEAVIAWMNSIPKWEQFTTAVCMAEIRRGISKMPSGRRRRLTDETANRLFHVELAGRILPFDTQAAELFGDIFETRRRSGGSYNVEDCMIAAIARSVGMAVATRNVRDFEGVGVDVIDPWAEDGPSISLRANGELT